MGNANRPRSTCLIIKGTSRINQGRRAIAPLLKKAPAAAKNAHVADDGARDGWR